MDELVSNKDEKRVEQMARDLYSIAEHGYTNELVQECEQLGGGLVTVSSTRTNLSKNGMQ